MKKVKCDYGAAFKLRELCFLMLSQVLLGTPAFAEKYQYAITVYTNSALGDDGIEFKPPTKLICGGPDHRCKLSTNIENGKGKQLTVSVFDRDGKELEPFSGGAAKYFSECDCQVLRAEFRLDSAVEIERVEIKGPPSGRVSFFYFGDHPPPHFYEE